MVYLEKPTDFKSKFEIVSCFFEYEGKFLLLHRQDHKPQGNTWGVPAGKVEEGESISDAMIRELQEETGYSGDKLPIFAQTVFVRYPEYDFIYHIFALDLSGLHSITINSKAHKAFKWVTPTESLVVNLIADLGECIKLHYAL